MPSHEEVARGDYTDELKREIRRWKRIAEYLAHWHAVTTFDLAVIKSTPKSRLDRLSKICLKAASFLEGSESPSPRHWGYATEEEKLKSVIDRCRNAAEEARRYRQGVEPGFNS